MGAVDTNDWGGGISAEGTDCCNGTVDTIGGGGGGIGAAAVVTVEVAEVAVAAKKPIT